MYWKAHQVSKEQQLPAVDEARDKPQNPQLQICTEEGKLLPTPL
jgi:hypothetical protein